MNFNIDLRNPEQSAAKSITSLCESVQEAEQKYNAGLQKSADLLRTHVYDSLAMIKYHLEAEGIQAETNASLEINGPNRLPTVELKIIGASGNEFLAKELSGGYLRITFSGNVQGHCESHAIVRKGDGSEDENGSIKEAYINSFMLNEPEVRARVADCVGRGVYFLLYNKTAP